MTQAKATVWTRADANGFYWWRYDKDATPEPVEVRDEMFYCLADPDPTSVSVGEFLGPVTPELFSEVVQLREQVEFAVANGNKWTHEDWINWIENHAKPALARKGNE